MKSAVVKLFQPITVTPYGSLTPFDGFLTAPKFKTPNVYRVPNGLTAKSPWDSGLLT